MEVVPLCGFIVLLILACHYTIIPFTIVCFLFVLFRLALIFLFLPFLLLLATRYSNFQCQLPSL